MENVPGILQSVYTFLQNLVKMLTDFFGKLFGKSEETPEEGE